MNLNWIGPIYIADGLLEYRDRRAGDATRAVRSLNASTRQDPFILEGLVKSFVIRDWNDTMLD